MTITSDSGTFSTGSIRTAIRLSMRKTTHYFLEQLNIVINDTLASPTYNFSKEIAK
jgi:hypothetical protein